jgi:hypothetical protein
VNVKGSAREPASAARYGDRANRRRPGSGVRLVLNPPRRVRCLARQASSWDSRHARTLIRRASSSVEGRAPGEAPVLRQRTTEVWLSGEASSADGRRRSAAAEIDTQSGGFMLCQTDGPKLARGKPALSERLCRVARNTGPTNREPTAFERCRGGALRAPWRPARPKG